MATNNESDDEDNNDVDSHVFQPLSLDDFLERQESDSGAVCAGDYSCTGVWQSARGLLEYLVYQHHHLKKITTNIDDNHSSTSTKAFVEDGQEEPSRDNVSPPPPSLHGSILELGAGTGWLGLQLAHHLGPKRCQRMLLTDRQGAWLQENIREAKRQGLCCDNVHAQTMDWGQCKDVEHVAASGPWNYVLGSDLVYSEEGVHYLARTMAILAGCHQCSYENENDASLTTTVASPPRILYAHTQGRMPELDNLWQEELQRHGLTWKIVTQLPVRTGDGQVWQGRTTLVMDIFSSAHEQVKTK
jgi:hypothetical protein